MPRKHNTTRQYSHTPDPFDGQPQDYTILNDDTRLEEPLEVNRMTHTAVDTTFEQEEHREAGKRDVEMYIRTYNTLLRSSGEVSLKAVVQAHYNIDSSLHPEARSPYPDMSAFIYSVLRLSAAIINCNLVLLGQAEEVFVQQGFHVDNWEGVTASARRRKWFYDGKETLAVYVASVSDTDDIVPILVAFQIEWNKMYYLLNADPTTMQLLETRMDPTSPVFTEISKVLRERLHIRSDDWRRLEVIWRDRLWEILHTIGQQSKSFALRFLAARTCEEQERGIWYVGARHGLEIDAQVFELAKLHPTEIDPRCRMLHMDKLVKSEAIILNIDYPLGMAAYRMMREIMENLTNMRGIYILGKAATLNGSIGDVMISNVVLDEHTQNTYWLDNCFTAQDVVPYLIYGSVLDNQKAVSAKGTYLQNRQYLDVYYRDNYTVVEMESGPYLNAVYEDQYLTRYPEGDNINFARLPYELGVLHYASDTPYTRAKNLGAGSLSYFGMDSTYACAVAIVRRIFENEIRLIIQQTTRQLEEIEEQQAETKVS